MELQVLYIDLLHHGIISNCYNTGIITSDKESLSYGVAGIATYCIPGININNVYNAGNVTGSSIMTSPAGESYFTGSNVLKNMYSLDGIEAKNMMLLGNASGGTDLVTTISNMKSADFTAKLNENRGENTEWITDSSNSNKGYPIFK